VRDSILAGASVGLGLTIACAPSSKTVANVTTGITGCPAESLVVFNYARQARTWSALCADRLYICSDGRGQARCTEQDPATIDEEQATRATALRQLPVEKRAWFADQNITDGDWPTFARLAGTVNALSVAQLSSVDPRLVYMDQSPELAQVVSTCAPDSALVADVSARGTVSITSMSSSVPFTHPCWVNHRPDLSKLSRLGQHQWLLAAGVSDVKPIARPKLSPTVAKAPAAASGVSAAAPAASPASPALDAAVRGWLDQQADAILACAGTDHAAVLVSVDAQAKADVTLRGVAAGGPEDGCVKHVLASPPPLPTGPAQILHIVKAPH
jgi:hypothetical protein